MRGSSTLVSVSSVSSRPSASVRSPLAAASSGTPNPAVQMVTRLGSAEPSASTTEFGRTSATAAVSRTVTPCRFSHLAIDRLPGSDSDGASRPPQTRVTARPCSASSAAVSIPVSPAPTTVTAASGVQLVEGGAQPLRELQFGYGISEFGRTRHRCRCRTGAADRIDHVVVVQLAARRKLHLASRGVDPRDAVDDERHACRRAACRSRPSRRNCPPRAGAAGSARRTSDED